MILAFVILSDDAEQSEGEESKDPYRGQRLWR